MSDGDASGKDWMQLLELASKPLRSKVLSDGRIVELWLQVYNFRITVTLPGNEGVYFDDMWCWKQSRMVEVMDAFTSWDGDGEPPGWNKHPPTGRWREDGTAASEINQRGDQP